MAGAGEAVFTAQVECLSRAPRVFVRPSRVSHPVDPSLELLTLLNHFAATTFDDLLRDVMQAALSRGSEIRPTKGRAYDLNAAVLSLSNPRARISRTETRGRLFSCLGEFAWYLAGSDSSDFVRYYIAEYPGATPATVIHGAYGPRLFGSGSNGQVQRAIATLRRNPDSRRAVVQLLDPSDLAASSEGDIPCTCTLQFLVRKSQLHMLVYMRSNDIYLGLPHDVFSFTMLQELVARSVNVPLGTYTHMVGSLHLYETNREAAEQFLAEGFQSTIQPMSAMPDGDPWECVEAFLKAEAHLRAGGDYSVIDNPSEAYWADLIALLGVFACIRAGDATGARAVRGTIAGPEYQVFVDEKIQASLRYRT